MGLSRAAVIAALDVVEVEGWDGAVGRGLLEQVRHVVVEPVVGRLAKRGPTADQAMATGWATAWELLNGPQIREAENPAGLIWVAVRRAVLRELGGSVWARGGTDPESGATTLPLEVMAESGGLGTAWGGDRAQELGRSLEALVPLLVDNSWERELAVEAIAGLADSARSVRGCAPRACWRRVARELGAPEWQVRRLAELLLGSGGGPGVLELMAVAGPPVLDDPRLRAAVRATTRRHLGGPSGYLVDLGGSGRQVPGWVQIDQI